MFQGIKCVCPPVSADVIPLACAANSYNRRNRGADAVNESESESEKKE